MTRGKGIVPGLPVNIYHGCITPLAPGDGEDKIRFPGKGIVLKHPPPITKSQHRYCDPESLTSRFHHTLDRFAEKNGYLLFLPILHIPYMPGQDSHLHLAPVGFLPGAGEGRKDHQKKSGQEPYHYLGCTLMITGDDHPWISGSYMHSMRAGLTMNFPGSSARMM